MFIRRSSLESVIKVWSTLWSTRAMLLANPGMTKGSAGTDSQHCQRFACASCVHIQKLIQNVRSDGKNCFASLCGLKGIRPSSPLSFPDYSFPLRLAFWRPGQLNDHSHISCCLFGQRSGPSQDAVFFIRTACKILGPEHTRPESLAVVTGAELHSAMCVSVASRTRLKWVAVSVFCCRGSRDSCQVLVVESGNADKEKHEADMIT